MPLIIKGLRNTLKEEHDNGKVWDDKLYKGLDAALNKLDHRLNGLFSLDAGIEGLKAVSDEIKNQAGTRIDSKTAQELASRVDSVRKAYESNLPHKKWYE